MNWSEEDLAADLASSESDELAFRKWCETGPGCFAEGFIFGLICDLKERFK